MGSDWENIKLGELILTNAQSYSKDDNWLFINYLDTGNITENDISDIQYLEVGKDKIPSRARRKVDAGDIIYSTVRPNQKHYGILKKPLENMLVSTGFTTIRCSNSKADTNFIYWFLTQNQIVEHLQMIGEHSASTYPSIKPSDIESLELLLPPLPEQKAIAHILGSLDDKIELNRQMNETLEAMAQALFKSWFVDFDPVIDNALAAGNPIPDEFLARAKQRQALPKSDSDNQAIRALFPDAFEFTEEMDWIPEGWEVTPLATLIKLTGGGTPKTSVEEYWNGNIPWFSVVDAPSSSDIFVLDTEKHVTSLGVGKSSTKILPVGTTIISARGTVGKCAMVSRPMAMNQSCYGVSGKEGISDTFVYYSVFLSVSELQNKGHGSVFNTITGDTFKSINVAFGGEILTKEFHRLVFPYFAKILENGIQKNTLAELRDTLLPKLMSGELRITDAAAMVDEV